MVTEQRKSMKSPLALGTLLLVALMIAACDASRTASSFTPRPAASVTAIPGLIVGQKGWESEAGRGVRIRFIEVFLIDEITRTEIEDMARQIAAMPEVEAYHLVTPQEAVARFGEMYPESDLDVTEGMLPASFDILVRQRKDVEAVARRFFTNPLVDNDPGTVNGVQYTSDKELQAIP